MRDAGMHMTKWQSNSDDFNAEWETKDEISETSKKFENEISCNVKVLGLAWHSKEDYFYFDMSNVLSFLKKRLDTKRFILQTAGRIFDPLGLISPFTIRIKIIFQELWVSGVEWDNTLPEAVQQKWSNWCREIKDLANVAIPRHYFGNVPQGQLQNVQLHTFCDASNKAYGAVVYARATTSDGRIITTLVSSKTRVAPLKKLTLPRLELMGAIVAARLSNNASNCLKVKHERFFWTDSVIVFYWIRTHASKFKPFVENRVREIHSLTEPSKWSHCPGKENPADFLSRGQGVLEMLENEIWWHGPSWLKETEGNWPKQLEIKSATEESREEMRTCFQDEHLILSAIDEQRTDILDVNKFSAFWKVIRVTAWVLRFVHNLRNANIKIEGCLTADELMQGELYWVQRAQENSYSREIRQIRENKPLIDSPIKELNPFVDDKGLLRLRGRIQEAEISFEEKHPLILPATSEITRLIIQDMHKRVMHGGTTETLAQVRRKFWVPKGRQVVRKSLRSCLTCKKFYATPGSESIAPLPRERLSQAPAFNTTGIDFFGPLYTKHGKHTEKSYVALFTCAVTRAVHLELVSDLSTEKFLMALKRFFARRGVCKTIMSDNAATFKRAQKELKEMCKFVKDETVQNFLGQNAISWKFIVSRASWWGGFWERLVRSVKTCLKKVLGRALLTFEEMVTLLTEIESVLNSRPLTYTYNEKSEPEPLTPAHFLVDGNIILSPPNASPFLTSTREELTRRIKYRQQLHNRIWKRWRLQYLLDLRSAHHTKDKTRKQIQKDDVVIIEEDKKPKMLWKMGVVTEVYTGRDGKVRSCSLRTANGNILERPIQLLYPLEIRKDNSQP